LQAAESKIKKYQYKRQCSHGCPAIFIFEVQTREAFARIPRRMNGDRLLEASYIEFKRNNIARITGIFVFSLATYGSPLQYKDDRTGRRIYVPVEENTRQDEKREKPGLEIGLPRRTGVDERRDWTIEESYKAIPTELRHDGNSTYNTVIGPRSDILVVSSNGAQAFHPSTAGHSVRINYTGHLSGDTVDLAKAPPTAQSGKKSCCR
jgi:hypothetical protein